MKSLTAKQLIRVLEAHGFFQSRQKGSHIIFKNGEGIMVPVPLHGKNKRIPLGTFFAIIKQSKISSDKFIS